MPENPSQAADGVLVTCKKRCKDMKAETLRKILEQRGVKTRGRKQELLERLLAYDRNDNFGRTCASEEQMWKLACPPDTAYRDIMTSTKLPKVSNIGVRAHFPPSEDFNQTAVSMYKQRYLRFVRWTTGWDKTISVKVCCRAMMFKKVILCRLKY